jgi:S1-C subfamily serine protease
LIIAEGKVRRGIIGIAGQTVRLHERLSAYHGLNVRSGMLVQQMETDGPAFNAELQPGDLIVGLDQHPVDDLHKLLDETTIGRPCSLKVLRRGRLQQLQAIPMEMK